MTTQLQSPAGRMPQPAQVEAMAGYGLSATEIARILDVDLEVLQSSCAHELATGQIKANARVAESLYRKALGDGREAVTAAIFWLKTRARWKESSVQEHAVRDDSPVTITLVAGLPRNEKREAFKTTDSGS